MLVYECMYIHIEVDILQFVNSNLQSFLII